MLREKLANKKFVVTVELEPPKGADPAPTLASAARLIGSVDAVNIADSPMATLRMSPIALSHILQQDVGMEAIFHLTCRDRNVLGLQSELLGAAALGVRNILTLTGDSPARGDHPDAKGVFEVDSTGLAKIAAVLNSGKDLMGKELNRATDFFIGGVANPGADDLDIEVERLKAKVAAGVRFVQTQPVFDIETVERFEAKAKDVDVDIIYGILPLKSYKLAKYLNDKVPGICINDDVLARVKAKGRAAGLAVAREMYEQLQSRSQGVHIFPIGDLRAVYEILGV